MPYASLTTLCASQFCEDLSKKTITQFDKGENAETNTSDETIFERLLSNDVRRREKGQATKPLTFRELTDESTAILNAGTEPTATMMAYGTYFFLRFPETQKRILDELVTVKLDRHGRMPLQELEALPYFVSNCNLHLFARELY